MKKLVFKKWYQKKNWCRNEKMENIHSWDVESDTCVLVGATEKAIICEHFDCHKFGRNKIFFPKSALIVMEENDEVHFEEMNKFENSEAALKEVNDYLATTNFASEDLVNDMAKMCVMN